MSDLTCPITGEPIEIVSCGDDHWMARTSLWTTRLFSDKAVLVHALSHRNGVPPDFPVHDVAVGDERMDKPNAFEDVKERQDIIADGAEEMVDRLMFEHRGGT